MSAQSNNTKKALNKIYTLGLKNKKRSGSRNRKKSNLIPKYSGCGPGGMNSSLMISHKSKEFKEDLSIQQQSSFMKQT